MGVRFELNKDLYELDEAQHERLNEVAGFDVRAAHDRLAEAHAAALVELQRAGGDAAEVHAPGRPDPRRDTGHARSELRTRVRGLTSALETMLSWVEYHLPRQESARDWGRTVDKARSALVELVEAAEDRAVDDGVLEGHRLG